MGSKFASDDDDVMSDINITPFVDIILVVLIIFMVTATTIVNSSIKVNLPEAASGEATESTSLGLTLTSDGRLLLDGAATDADGVIAAIEAASAEDTDVVCLIAADKDVTHGRVVWLMDLVKTQGVAKFAINIDKANIVPPDPANTVPAEPPP
jgi:biopolymer transport protein ExbD